MTDMQTLTKLLVNIVPCGYAVLLPGGLLLAHLLRKGESEAAAIVLGANGDWASFSWLKDEDADLGSMDNDPEELEQLVDAAVAVIADRAWFPVLIPAHLFES